MTYKKKETCEYRTFLSAPSTKPKKINKQQEVLLTIDCIRYFATTAEKKMIHMLTAVHS